jgi:hypothetical protein
MSTLFSEVLRVRNPKWYSQVGIVESVGEVAATM